MYVCMYVFMNLFAIIKHHALECTFLHNLTSALQGENHAPQKLMMFVDKDAFFLYAKSDDKSKVSANIHMWMETTNKYMT